MKYYNFANRVSDNNKPEILMSLIDLSPSMNFSDYKPSRKAGAIRANKELLKIKLDSIPQDKMGIIGFGDDAKLLHLPVCLSTGSVSLQNALKNPQGSYGTNFTAALKLAKTHLLNGNSSKSNGSFLSRMLSEMFIESANQPENLDNNNVLRRIIMLTDGEYNSGGCPLKIALELKNKGVVIDCIGIVIIPPICGLKCIESLPGRALSLGLRYSRI